MRNFFLKSLFLHLCLLAAFVIWRPLPRISPPPALFVDLDSGRDDQTNSSAKVLKQKENSDLPRGSQQGSKVADAVAKPLRHGESLREFSPHGSTNHFRANESAGEIDSFGWPRVSDVDKDATHSYFQSLTFKKEGKFSPFAQKILKQVDSYVGYPPDFIEENFAGEVVVQFLVSPEGKFLRFLHVDGEQKALTLYSMAMVILALNRELANLPQDRPSSNIPISLALSYRLLLPDEISNRRPPSAFKNSLQLERVAFTEPQPIKKARRAIEKYTPPIIPVPGGFFVDFVALYKRFAETGSDDPDWERKARMLLDRETLEAFLKSQS